MKNMLIAAAVLVLATGIVAAGLVALLQPNTGTTTPTVTVQGQAQRDVMPDQAKLSFSVVTEANTSEAAAQQNAQRMSAVVAALKGYGTVETQQYTVYPVYDYGTLPAGSSRDLHIQFYRATNTVQLTMTNTSTVGDAIDAGVNAGANSVPQVSYDLTDALRKQVQTQLLTEAGQHAKTQAQAVADGLGVSLGKVKSVSESNVNFPGPIMYAREASTTGSSAPSTPAEPSKVTVSATVSVTYAIS